MTMVAETSKHNAEFIMKKMSFADALRFRTVYWISKNIEVESVEQGVEIKRVMQ